MRGNKKGGAALALENLKPQSVFRKFEQLSAIPRGSGNERQAAEWICAFAKDRGLWAHMDERDNVIVRKPGSYGLEGRPAVILQAHIDMVCEKTEGSSHDFLKDGIKLIVDGDFIKASETTLGADNGIGAAMILALLESSDIAHPPLEALFTSDEETGMTGAHGLDGSLLAGRRLINLDSEDEGVFCASCAGGLRTEVALPLDRIDLPSSCGLFKLKVKGLKGGHSGMDIDKGRANSNQLLGRILTALLREGGVWVCSIDGGSKDNALPRESEAVLAFNREMFEKVAQIVYELGEVFKKEFSEADPGVLAELAPEGREGQRRAWTRETALKAAALMISLPSGVHDMSPHIPGLVQTSSCLAVIKASEDKLSLHVSIRSSVASLKLYLRDKTEALAKLAQASAVIGGEYPEWEYSPNSELREAALKAWEEGGGNPRTEAVHAGLECGLFARKLPGADMISFGPNIYDVHSPEERVSISSVDRVWKFLTRLLQAI
jgi:dipeptidase D